MNVPRRIRLDLSTPAELDIRSSMRAVEAAGADPRLTKALNLLGEALGLVADYVDGVPERTDNGWVSVKYRVPGKDEFPEGVLVSIGYPVTRRIAVARRELPEVWSFNMSNPYSYGDVTHWRRLPTYPNSK